MSALPPRLYGDVTVTETKSGLRFAKTNMKEPLYSHVVHAWLFGFLIADKVLALANRDREAHSVAAIFHDLG